MNALKFKGVYTALVTPMSGDKVNYQDLSSLVEEQIKQGITGLVPVGTTGESPTLDHEEHIKVINCVVEVTNGRVPVIAGCGSNSTHEAVSLTRKADAIGADAFLHVTPYYNKPSQEGLFQHFSSIAEVTEKPIVLYSIPPRCVIEIGLDTLKRLADKFENVRTLKEAGGNPDRVATINASLGENYVILSGDDALTLPFIISGAKGVISVASNLIPSEIVKMVEEALEGRFDQASSLHQKYLDLFHHLFLEPSPVPIKFAMAKSGLIESSDVKLPLCRMAPANQQILLNTLKELGLI